MPVSALPTGPSLLYGTSQICTVENLTPPEPVSRKADINSGTSPFLPPSQTKNTLFTPPLSSSSPCIPCHRSPPPPNLFWLLLTMHTFFFFHLVMIRWCPTYPEYFAVSTNAPTKGAIIHVYNTGYIHAQPTVFNIGLRPLTVRSFDFLAGRGIPRIAAAVGRDLVIFYIGVES